MYLSALCYGDRLLIMLLLLAAAIWDIRTHCVPALTVPFGIAVHTGYLLCGSQFQDMLEGFLCGALLFLLLFQCMKLGSLGGADVLIGALFGYCLGWYGFYAVFFAFLTALPYTIYMKVKNCEHEYPFVPYMCIGYILAVLISSVC